MIVVIELLGEDKARCEWQWPSLPVTSLQILWFVIGTMHTEGIGLTHICTIKVPSIQWKNRLSLKRLASTRGQTYGRARLYVVHGG